MTLPIVLAIAGSIALLIGLFGGGVKAKEIEVPRISAASRIFSILSGVAMIGIAIWLSFPNLLPSPNVTPETANETAAELATSTTVPEFGWMVYFEIGLREGFWKPGTNSYQILADCPDSEVFAYVDQRIEFSVDENAPLFSDEVVELRFFGIPPPNKGASNLSSIHPHQKTKIILGYSNISFEQATQALNECQVKAIVNDIWMLQLSPVGPTSET
jgi:hypothetical protein